MALATYGTRLAAATDLPARGQVARGSLAAAYRCAARLLQSPGGMADCIAEEEEIDWQELNFRSIDVREFLARDIAAGDIAALEAECRAALLDEEYVSEAVVSVTFAGGALEVEAQIIGDEGPFGFVLRITDTDGAALRAV